MMTQRRLTLKPAVSTRDRRTIEIRNHLEVPSPGEQTCYNIDRWFFFPRNASMGVDGWTREAFYGSSQVLMRLQPLSLDLVELADLADLSNPGHLLLNRVEMLHQPVACNGESMTAIAQLYGAELVDALNESVRAVSRLASQGTAGLEAKIHNLCFDTFAALDTLRFVRRSTLPYEPVAHRALIPSLAFAEEFACAMVDERFSELGLELGREQALRDGTCSVAKCQLILAQALQRLNRRRRDQGFVMPARHAGEDYSYRMGLLKKELQRSLYIDARATRSDPLVANSAAMVAAGLAATWATIAQVPLFQANLTTTKGLIVFGMAVGAYVLKDRIKDVVKTHLVKRWKPWDHDQRIIDNIFHHIGAGGISGRSRERVGWITEQEIAPEVLAVRQAHRTVRGSSTDQEQVLHYTRRIELEGVERPADAEFGISSIFRFSLADIMARLEDPVDEIAYYDAGFHEGAIPKIYHVNLVHRTRNESTGEEWFTRTRIVINRKRILRVEEVESDLD